MFDSPGGAVFNPLADYGLSYGRHIGSLLSGQFYAKGDEEDKGEDRGQRKVIVLFLVI